MRAIDAYRGVRRELDKTASPSFSVRDFNYFFNTAVLDYVSENHASLDIRGKEDDDLNRVVTYDFEATGLSGNRVDLPANYRHTLGVRVEVKFIQNVDEFKKDDVVTFNEVVRLRTGARGVENAYKQPSHRKVYYRTSDGKMYIDGGNKLQLQKVLIDYVKIGTMVYLNPDTTANFDLEDNNTTLPFNEDVCYEVVRRCAATMLENRQNPRYGSVLQEKRLRQE